MADKLSQSVMLQNDDRRLLLPCNPTNAPFTSRFDSQVMYWSCDHNMTGFVVLSLCHVLTDAQPHNPFKQESALSPLWQLL